MWQRVQSILLVVTMVSLVVFLTTNSYIKVLGSDEKIVVNAFHVFHQKGDSAIKDEPTFYVAVLAILGILVTIFTLFQYKNRLRQMLFVALNSLIIGVALAITVYHIQNTADKMGGSGGTFYVGLWAAFAALASNWLANRFIKKDEKLVRDADSRLR